MVASARKTQDSVDGLDQLIIHTRFDTQQITYTIGAGGFFTAFGLPTPTIFDMQMLIPPGATVFINLKATIRRPQSGCGEFKLPAGHFHRTHEIIQRYVYILR